MEDYDAIYHQRILDGESPTEYVDLNDYDVLDDYQILNLDAELKKVNLQSEKENEESLNDWFKLLNDSDPIQHLDDEYIEYFVTLKALEDELDELQDTLFIEEENYRKHKRYNRARRKKLK